MPLPAGCSARRSSDRDRSCGSASGDAADEHPVAPLEDDRDAADAPVREAARMIRQGVVVFLAMSPRRPATFADRRQLSVLAPSLLRESAVQIESDSAVRAHGSSPLTS